MQQPYAVDTSFDPITDSLDPQMYIVTMAVAEERSGCLVGFGSQCSIDPSRFIVWMSELNHTYALAKTCEFAAVHLPRVDSVATARHFGSETGDEVDKFADVEWHPGPNGSPVIAGLTWFEGRVLDRVDGGDHLGLLLAPEHSGVVSRDVPVLRLRDVGDVEPGHPAD
jgi:flavin reductase (DIM6/NTAB) family NADH-FMN oxidoreductase RutF